MKILAPLIGDPRTRVTKENAEIVNDISVCFCMDLLIKSVRIRKWIMKY